MLKFIWEDKAVQWLEARDRYTRNTIRDEFRLDPQKEAVELDPATHDFLTPVADNRFQVYWRFDATTQSAIVRGVVSLTSFNPASPLEPTKLQQLKEYVQHTVEAG
jgi:hypothetical protein